MSDMNNLYSESILYEGEKVDLWRRIKIWNSIRVNTSAVVEINAHKKISIEEIKLCK